MSKSASEKKNRIYFICHRQELVDQTAKTFRKFGLEFGFIAAGWPINFEALIQICSIDTLKNRLDKIPYPSVCIWDEAHHVAAGGWATVKGHFHKAKHIGLSATPERLDGKGLADYFEYMVLGPTVTWLIDEGYLSDYTLYSGAQSPDMSHVHTKMGDFVKSETEFIMDNSQITGGIIRHWKKNALGKRTIGFAVSIAHSNHIVEQFKQAGIRAIHLDGKSTSIERRAVAKSFANGDLDVLWNVGLFGEGYDLSAQADTDVTVDCVIDAAPTQSLAAYLQRVGRALRPKSDKSKAILLDHADNWKRHGLPDDERNWLLEGDKNRRKKSEEASILTRQCKQCYAIHKPAASCPECGYVYVIQSRDIEEVEADMVEVNKEIARKEHKREQGAAQSLDDLIALGEKRGYKNAIGWASHIYTARLAKERRQA
jgi:superfamily II DNA or RNA helicase